jgi:hypothetical protein
MEYAVNILYALPSGLERVALENEAFGPLDFYHEFPFDFIRVISTFDLFFNTILVRKITNSFLCFYTVTLSYKLHEENQRK